jgi:hypothetical protein
MRVYASKIQTVEMSSSALAEAHAKYFNLVNKNLFLLYEHGLLDTPSEYKEGLIRSALVDILGSDIDYISSNLTGDLDISALRIKYALTALKDHQGVSDLQVLHDYLSAKENLDDISEALRISKKFNYSVKPLISISRLSVTYRCKINFANPAVIKCIKPMEGYKLQALDLKLPTYKSLCKLVGVPSRVVQDAIRCNKSIFIPNTTLRKEIEFLPLLITGDLYCNSKWDVNLDSAVISYYKERGQETKVYQEIPSYASYVLDKSYDLRSRVLNAKIAKLGEVIPVGVSLYSAFAYVKGVEVTRHVSTPKVTSNLGAYAITNQGEEFQYYNLISGVCGEFLSSKDIRTYKLKVHGLPTYIKTLELCGNQIIEHSAPYYSILQLTTADGEAIQSCVGEDYKVFPYTLDYVASFLGTSAKNIVPYIYMSVAPKLEVEISLPYYKNMITEFVYLFLCAKCGVLSPKLEDRNRSYYTDELVKKACYEAELYVKDLLAKIK